MKMRLKKMTPLIAILLVIVVVANTIWVSAAQVSIQRIEEDGSMGTATNYLIDNTDYISEDILQRLYEVLTLSKTPTTWQGYEEQAGIYIAQENYDRALECLEQAIKLSDGVNALDASSLWLQKGCLHTIKEEYEDAVKSLETCVKMNPNSSECYLILAQLYLEREDEEHTLSNMEAYLELNPGNTEAEQMVAQLYMSKQDFVSARKWLERAMESGGGAEVYYQYGLCAIQESDFEGATDALDRTIEMDDSVGDVYYYRGICRLTKGEYEAALEDLFLAQEKTEDENIKSEIVSLIQQLTGGQS